jgi:hypothetical protein
MTETRTVCRIEAVWRQPALVKTPQAGAEESVQVVPDVQNVQVVRRSGIKEKVEDRGWRMACRSRGSGGWILTPQAILLSLSIC